MTEFEVPAELPALLGILPDDWAWDLTHGARRGNCITSALLITTILRRLGVKSRAVATDVDVTNRVAETAYGVPLSADDKKQIPGWMVIGVRCSNNGPAPYGEPGSKRGFSGHLIVVGDGWFCDPTLEQFHRPDQGVTIEGAVFGPTGGEVSDGEGVRYQRADGGAIRWYFRPRLKSWRRSPAWRQGVDNNLRDAMCTAVRQTLAGERPVVEFAGTIWS